MDNRIVVDLPPQPGGSLDFSQPANRSALVGARWQMCPTEAEAEELLLAEDEEEELRSQVSCLLYQLLRA